MFENLSDRLERSFKILKGEGKITEVNVAETIKEIRRALLDADVSYKVAKEFCDRVKTKAMGADVLTAVKPQQMLVKIVHDELADFMGSEHAELNLKGSPAIVLVAGLNGSGKTTFSGHSSPSGCPMTASSGRRYRLCRKMCGCRKGG